jgi:hypothetical protein
LERVYGFIESLGNLQVCIFVIFLLFNYGINYKIKPQELLLPEDICEQAFQKKQQSTVQNIDNNEDDDRTNSDNELKETLTEVSTYEITLESKCKLICHKFKLIFFLLGL